MTELDRLATYDNDAIGREFAPNATAVFEEKRRHQSRRQELVMRDWKDSFSDSTGIPKSALTHVRKFENNKCFSESLITWILTIVLSALAGTICAIVIKHLNM